MEIIRLLSELIVPIIFIGVIGAGIFKKTDIFNCFVEGAKEGLSTVIHIIPHLIGLISAIAVFRVSGAMEIIIYALKPVTSLMSIPPEILPLALLRPVSGSASLALLEDILRNYGPDSFIGKTASTLMGSTETIFYTITIYFGSINIKKIRYTLVAALIADIASVFATIFICGFLF